MRPPPPALEAEPVLTVEMTAPVWEDTERDPGPPPDSALARVWAGGSGPALLPPSVLVLRPKSPSLGLVALSSALQPLSQDGRKCSGWKHLEK